jgi:hypothetical protein
MSRRIVMPAVTAMTAAAVFTTGCFDLPPYKPPTSVDYIDDKSGGGGTAKGPDFSLHFAGGGFHFPDKLTIGSVDDVLGHASQGCHDESEAGIQIAPTLRISADSNATQATNALMPVLRGPAAVQVKLDWASQFACRDNTSVVPKGTSTFTVFPDGRIVRDDRLEDPNPPDAQAPTAGVCACDPAEMNINGFTVSSYWAFAQQHLQNLYSPDMTPPIMLPIQNEITSPSIACIAGDAFQVGFSWPTNDQSTIHGAGTLIAFGRYNGINGSGLEGFPWENSLAMFIERGSTDCVTTLAHAKAYNVPATSALSINGSQSISASLRDGIYGGAGDSGQPGIMVTADRVELTGTVGTSFAVWLRFPHAVDTLRATIANPMGAWYLPQQVANDSWIVWFRDPLSPGQTITIKPN